MQKGEISKISFKKSPKRSFYKLKVNEAIGSIFLVTLQGTTNSVISVRSSEILKGNGGKKTISKNYHIRPFVYGVPKPDASNEKLLNYFSLTRICHFEDNIIMIQL